MLGGYTQQVRDCLLPPLFDTVEDALNGVPAEPMSRSPESAEGSLGGAKRAEQTSLGGAYQGVYDVRMREVNK